ncbi:phthiocerol/phthiodiolone dimycocerosyl transferase family protein [Nocardia asteroides]
MMTALRALSPFETSYFGSGTRIGSVPVGGMPLFIGSTVHGVLDVPTLRRVLAELAAAHPLLRSEQVVDAGGAQCLRRDDSYLPRLAVTEGGESEYLELLNTPQDWNNGLFHAHLFRAGDRDRIVLIIHHGIADGRSAFALLAELWERYTAHVTGAPAPRRNSDQRLPEAMDTRLARIVSDAEVAGLLNVLRAGAAMMSPELAPRHLPEHGARPGGGLTLDRIELDDAETAAVVAAALAHGLSVNSLIGGAAFAAFRAQWPPSAGTLPMVCGHAVDVRADLVPPLTASTVLNCVSGAGTFALVDAEAGPVELGHVVAAEMRASADRREALGVMLAAQRVTDPATAALFSAQNTFTISNIGRVPAHSTPPGMRIIRDDVFAMAPGMPPKLTVFTVGDRMTIQVEYDTARHSETQLGEVRGALLRALTSVRAA